MARFQHTSDGVRAACACLFVALAVSGCRDATDDLTAVLVAEETRAALVVQDDLPSFPEMVGEARAQGTLSRAMDLWLDSWGETGEPASRLREVAYHDGARVLAENLGHDAVIDAHVRLGEVLAATSRLEAGSLPENLAGRVARAAEFHDRAAELLHEGRDAEALAAVLRGSDALRTVGPRGIAEVLIRRADSRFQAVSGTLDEAERTRADRLIRGARLAMETEDWSRAVRRAYYACQVLGVSPR